VAQVVVATRKLKPDNVLEVALVCLNVIREILAEVHEDLKDRNAPRKTLEALCATVNDYERLNVSA
jgi:hypothetical protein